MRLSTSPQATKAHSATLNWQQRRVHQSTDNNCQFTGCRFCRFDSASRPSTAGPRGWERKKTASMEWRACSLLRAWMEIALCVDVFAVSTKSIAAHLDRHYGTMYSTTVPARSYKPEIEIGPSLTFQSQLHIYVLYASPFMGLCLFRLPFGHAPNPMYMYPIPSHPIRHRVLLIVEQ